jgi:cathepsin B
MTFSSTSGIKSWITQFGTVVSTMEIYSDFLGYKGGLYRVSPTAKLVGSHVVVNIVGYNDAQNYWVIRLPYGPSWGGLGQGFAWVSRLFC